MSEQGAHPSAHHYGEVLIESGDRKRDGVIKNGGVKRDRRIHGRRDH